MGGLRTKGFCKQSHIARQFAQGLQRERLATAEVLAGKVGGDRLEPRAEASGLAQVKYPRRL